MAKKIRKGNKTITASREEVDVMIVSKGTVVHRIYPRPTTSTLARIQRIYIDSVHNPSVAYLGLSDRNYTMIWRRK